MDWQQIISLGIVTIALILLVRSEVKKYKLRKSRLCGGDCECTALKELSAKKIK